VVFVAAGLETRRADAKEHQILVPEIPDSLPGAARDQDDVSRAHVRLHPADLYTAPAVLDDVALVDG
jgi:hypothetical protein